MKITSRKLNVSHTTTNDEALQKCQSALEKRDRSDYEGAREVMRPLWKRIGERPEVKGLHASVSAEVSGESSESNLVDSEVWPEQLILFWEDPAGQRHSLSRPISGELSNLDDPLKGPVAFKVESYGQGETAEISKAAHKDPVALLNYLDRFIDITESLAEEEAARDELLSIQTEIEKATKKVDLIPQYERTLATTQQQLVTLKKAQAEDVIELQQKLAGEREIRSAISTKLAALKDDLEAFSPSILVEEIAGLADAKSLAVGASEFKMIIEKARIFETAAMSAQSNARNSLEVLRKDVEIQINSWRLKEASALRTIEDKRKALEAKGIRLDMGYIRKLAKDEAEYKTAVTNLRTWKPHLVEQKAKYRAASKRRWAARSRIATTREAYARVVSDTLKAALRDLTVSLKFSANSSSPDAERQIIQAMGWRTIQVPRAALMIRQLTMPGLIQAVEKRDGAAIGSVVADDGTKIFTKAEVDGIIARLSEPTMLFALERCAVYDIPRLTVTKTIADASGKSRAVTKEFAKLSLGQQQSVLLALMLSSGSNAPLIIDQPEDNLDGEFIYRSLVPVLRMAKERRQVIVVTHNPNIAVLGDAEQIIALRSTSEKGTIVSRGAIDDRETRDIACDILEGAKEAFQRRARIYGIR